MTGSNITFSYRLLFVPEIFTAVDYPAKWIWLLILPLISVVYLLRRNRDNHPPGPWGWPIIGHLKYFQNKPYLQLSHLKSIYGDIYSLKVGSHNIVVVCSVESILEGLVHKGESFSHRPDFQSFHALYDGDRQKGIGTGDMTEKCTVMKSFVNSSIDSYCSSVENIEDKLTIEITDVVNRFLETSADAVDPAVVLESACLNVMLNLVFGQRVDPQGRKMKVMLNTFHLRSSTIKFSALDFIPMLKAFSPREDLEFVRHIVEHQLENHRNVLNWHKDSYDPNCIRDMTDHLLYFMEMGEDRGLFSKEDLDNILLDLMNFGYEAVAVTLTWLLGYMAANPDVQREVQKELDAVVGRDRLPSLRDQPFLPYTTAVIFEAERLASVYPFLKPHVASETALLDRFIITKGTIVLFNVWSVHHDPRNWKNPMKFDPNRFLNADRTLDIPDHFLPYGAGPRQCSGESLAEVELFLFFSHLMHQLSVCSTLDHLELQQEYDFLIRPQPFQLLITERLDC